MKLTHQEVLKIADLARLELSPDEVEKYSTQLSAILNYVEKLNLLDVKNIEPTAHAVMVPTPLRPDVGTDPALAGSPLLENSLANAPDREDSFFKVPKVLA